jgi:cardiolipin synthase
VDGSTQVAGVGTAVGGLTALLQGRATSTGRTRAARWPRRPTRITFPPGADAIAPADAAAHADALLRLPAIRRRDEALSFAPTSVTAVEPLVHGWRYFPRILEDIASARHHVHVLIYAFRPGRIGDQVLEALRAAVESGAEVRVAVDAIGSGIDFGSRRLYRQMRDIGIEVVANDGIAVVRGGSLGGRRLRLHAEDAFHFDHRKMMVIDGRIAYVGGTGIEDHFHDTRFTDIMCRVTGPVVSQVQLAYVASWVKDGGTRPTSLEGLFPPAVAADPGAEALEGVTATVLMNVPGTGHHPIRDAIHQSLSGAETAIDVVNPYISNRGVIRRLIAAAVRGVPVRIIIPAEPRPPYPMAAFRSWLPALLDAGAEVLAHPGMAHAKVYRIDDRLLIGSCNLDDLSLYRNDELDILFEGPAVPDLAAVVFDQLADASSPAVPSTSRRSRAWERTMARVSRLL